MPVLGTLLVTSAPAFAQDAPVDSSSDLAWFCAGIAVVGLCLAIWPFYSRAKSRRISVWPEAKAEILRHEVQEFDASSSDSWEVDNRYRPIPHYRYSAGGATLDGATIGDSAPIFRTREDAGAFLVSTYPVGATVPVYFDPRRPKNAMLVRQAVLGGGGLGVANWINIVVGAVLFVVFAIAALALFNQ